MNLYIFNKSSKAAVFGIGTYIRELTDALRYSNINVCVVNLWSEKPQIQFEEINGIRHWYFPEPIQEQRTIKQQKKLEQLYQRNIVYLLQLHIEDKRDLIFHLNYMDSKPLANSLRAVFDCKIVLVVHYLDSIITLSGNISRLRRIIQTNDLSDEQEIFIKESFQKEKEMFHAVDKIICLSNNTFDLLHNDYKIDKNMAGHLNTSSQYMSNLLCNEYQLEKVKLSVIPNGLNYVDTMPVNTKKDLHRKWYISEKGLMILFAGRLHQVKGLEFLIRAFRKVLEKIPDCRLIIAGSGGHYDTYFRECKDIYTKVTFTGLLKKEELYELYQIADIGIIPSLYEPFGYVALEMMMHELPIVATETSGLNEVVDDTCGLKIPLIEQPDKVEIDTNLLAEKILYLLQNPLVAKEMGQNGRKRYLKEYPSEVFRRNMLNFYASLFDYGKESLIL